MGMVDPLKDVQGTTLALNGGQGAMTAALADQGLDFEETIDQIAYEQQYIKGKGVKIGADIKGDASAADNGTEATGIKLEWIRRRGTAINN